MTVSDASMSVLPFIIVLILNGRLRKSVKTEGILPKWDKPLKGILYFAILLISLEAVFKVEFVTMWIWNLFLPGLIYVIYKEKDFASLKSFALSIIPYAIVAIFNDFIKTVFPDTYEEWENYIEVANLLTVVWMIAMWFNSNKQQKALEKERQRRIQEEAINKVISARKDELEGMVEKRTAELTQQKEELELALGELKNTQNQLIQQEKLASLGELTAGIAHEIQNPLNFVNNFSEVSIELLDELETELSNGNKDDVIAIASDIKQNLQKISHHGKRADSIVKGMLQHSRLNNGRKEPASINALADEYLRLSYHGLRAKDKSFNATLQTELDPEAGDIEMIAQDIGRVLLNLFNNGFYSVSQKKKTAGPSYEPILKLTTRKLLKAVEIKVRDNGTGIPKKVIEKMYQPFFTTKPTGEGTGLGLSMSYDIITNGHGGELKAETKEGEYAEFTIILPVNS